MRYRLTLQFDGARYHGWQIQPSGVSVQEVVQQALSTLLGMPVEIVAAGRTDAGVHATMMPCHFDVPMPLDTPLDTSGLHYRLNKILPRDISVLALSEAAPDWHARFSAVSRTYYYYVHTQKNPFLRNYSWQLYCRPDFQLMNEAAKVLTEYSDFTTFCKVNTDVRTHLCRLTEARWDEIEPSRWRFTITSDRFLRNMVRAVVGTLMEVGRGRMTIEEMRAAIEARNRCRAGESVPAHALFLHEVKY